MFMGANGYMLKSADTNEIENAIRSVHDSGYYYSDRVSHVLLHGLVKKQKVKPIFQEVDPLSERELEVLRGICQEMTNTEIAGKLFISPRTVSVHVTHILEKLDVENRSAAVALALRSGAVQPRPR